MSTVLNDRRLEVIDPRQIDFGKRYRDDYGENWDDFVADISERGFIQPISVLQKDKLDAETLATLAPSDSDKPYLLLTGGRRTTAAIELNKTEIPAQVYEHTIDRLELRIIELHENTQREQLPFSDETKLRAEIHRLSVEKYGPKTSTSPNAPGVSLTDTAKSLGISKMTMSSDVRLAAAMEEFPELEEAESRSDAWKMFDNKVKQIARSILTQRLKAAQLNNATPSNEENIRRAIATTYQVGSFFDGVKKIDNELFKIAEIDPPYAIDLKNAKREGKTDEYNEIDIAVYAEFMQATLNETYRVLAKNSWLICWFGPDPWFEPMFQWIIGAGKPADVSLEDWVESKEGFQCRRLPGIWQKRNGQTQQPDKYLAQANEFFFYARKGDPGIVKPGRTNIFDYAPVSPSKKRHPTERPIEMISSMLETFARQGDRVLVPFAGSGNTLLAAQNLNMPALGWDLSQEYKDRFLTEVMTGPLKNWISY